VRSLRATPERRAFGRVRLHLRARFDQRRTSPPPPV
jgi:hypothetical protein